MTDTTRPDIPGGSRQPGPTPWWSSPGGTAATDEPRPAYDEPTTAPDAPQSSYGAGGEAPTGPLWGPPPGEPARPPRQRRSVATLVAVALGAGLLGGGAGAAATYAITDNGSSSAVSSLSAAPVPATNKEAVGPVVDVAKAVLPSVVSINVRSAQGSGTGSGFVLTSDGEILTNNHVVESAAGGGGQITVDFNDGRQANATILGRDPVTDLAVIKAQGVSGLKPATLGSSSSLKVGQQVVAIGSPLGLSGTVTTGIVSALDRPVRTGGAGAPGEDRSTVIDAVQTDAPINPGNSGGPLVDMQGRVVGINSAIASLGPSGGGQSGSIGLGFSIPIDQARPIAEQLASRGSATHALLGVSVTDATQNGLPAGAGIVAVQQGGAAAAAGIQRGDVVTAVDGRRIDSADALIAAVRSHRPGDKVELTWERGAGSSGGGTQQKATVTLGSDTSGS